MAANPTPNPKFPVCSCRLAQPKIPACPPPPSTRIPSPSWLRSCSAHLSVFLPLLLLFVLLSRLPLRCCSDRRPRPESQPNQPNPSVTNCLSRPIINVLFVRFLLHHPSPLPSRVFSFISCCSPTDSFSGALLHSKLLCRHLTNSLLVFPSLSAPKSLIVWTVSA